MSKRFCIANWKMYLNAKESINFLNTFLDHKTIYNCEVVICPSSISLSDVNLVLKRDTLIKLGSQDVSFHDKGAYTGEVSLDMLIEKKCSYSILGHSERRLHHKENNSDINQKLNLIDSSSLTPIVCIGETLDEKQDNITEEILYNQISEIFRNNKITKDKDCLIAYEPIWAIGTGISADMNTIKDIHSYIKNIIQKFNKNYRNIYLLYGGSVNENNASDILDINNVDGFLIGSSSIDPEKFSNICNKF